jgi:hypothetical protein
VWHIIGVQTTSGERVKAVGQYLGDNEYFLCTYGDELTDVPLDDMIDRMMLSGRSVRPAENAEALKCRGLSFVTT